MNRLVHSLSAFDSGLLLRHFKALDDDDRRLRFGTLRSDELLEDYVAGIDFGRDQVFGVFTETFELAAVAHVGRLGNVAEVGLSVLRPYRREGLAERLTTRALRSAVNHGCERLWIHFLTDNHAMTAFVRKLGMTVQSSLGESDAWLALPRATPLAVGFELYEKQVDLLYGVFRHYVVREVPRAA